MCPVSQLLVFRFKGPTNILSLESIPSTPYCEREYEHNGPGNLCSSSSPDVREVKSESKYGSSKHLRDPVERIVERASAYVELCKVDILELVRVEPIRSEEHRKEKHDI
jgi:hypothetical protein